MRTAIFAIAVTAFCSAAWSQPYAVGEVSMGFGDARGWGGSIGGGYRLNRNFALEAKLNDLPKGDEQTVSTSGNIQTQTHRTWDGKSFSVSAVGLLPLGDVAAIFGRVSAHYVDADSRRSDAVINLAFPTSVLSESTTTGSEKFWAPAFGIGLQAASGKANLRLMFETLNGDSSVQPKTLNMLSAGITVSF